MKVGVLSRVVHPLHGFGGLERHVGALVKYLAREGAEVTLVTTPPEREAVMADVHVVSVAYRKIPWPRRAGFVRAGDHRPHDALRLRPRHHGQSQTSIRKGRSLIANVELDHFC